MQLAQQFVIDELVTARRAPHPRRRRGADPRAHRRGAGRRRRHSSELGIEVVAVRVAAVAPTAELEKALQQPTREAIQQDADKATFQRRALAVEKERAIAENELQNRIELARREEDLVAQEGANERTRAQEHAAAAMVEAQGADERGALAAGARGDDDRSGPGRAAARSSRARAEIDAAMAADVLLALAVRELAGQLGQIEHLTITPDMLTPLLGRLNGSRGEPGPALRPGRAPDRVPRPARAPRHARAGAVLPRPARARPRRRRGAPPAPRGGARPGARRDPARRGGPRPCSAPTSTGSCSPPDDIVLVLGPGRAGGQRRQVPRTGSR